MNKFRKPGFIKYNGALEVHNSLLNMVLRDNPHIRRPANKDHRIAMWSILSSLVA
jgi:CRP/FNR family transcriptional regulator, cyclic AMP receptor protein